MSDKRFSGTAGALARLKPRLHSTQLNQALIAWHSMKAGEGARGPSNSLDRDVTRLPQAAVSLNSILNLLSQTAWHSTKAGEGARGPSNSLDRDVTRLPQAAVSQLN